jgi:hypothetical protein
VGSERLGTPPGRREDEMTINLDSVLTVAIGRNTADGSPLSDADWSDFQAEVARDLGVFGTIVGSASGSGIGSDGVNTGQDEESAIFVALVDCDQLGSCRASLAGLIGRYGQSSACFAYDLAHEPVFPTVDGFRPRVAPVADFLADSSARRTQRFAA